MGAEREADVRAFLARYGRAPRRLTVEPLPGGEVNLNLRLDADGERLVLRRYDRTDPAEVAWELALLRHLLDRGFPTAPLLSAADGALASPFGGRPAALFGFVEGRHPDARSASALAEVGGALARLHELTADVALPDSRQRKEAGQRLREAASALRAVGVGPDAPRLARLVGDVERFHDALVERLGQLGAGLPRGIVHEDAHAGNVLVDDDDRLLALLDFDDARPTYLVAEIASLAVWWGYEKVGYGIDPARAAAAVSAYTRHRPLTEEEWELLPDFMAQNDLLSAIAYVSWRIGQGMPPEQAVELCDSYARFREVTADDDWRGRLRGAVRR